MPERMEPFEGEPDSTREAIMQATYDALATHGYVDLTIQRIGDEFAKSKSLLYHHYDSKDDLLIDFLGFMLERMAEDVPFEEQPDAHQQLGCAFDHVFGDLLSDERVPFIRALVELRAQGAHGEAFREQFTANEAFLRSRLTEIVEQGVAEGTFREVDPERVVDMLLTVVDGAFVRYTTVEDADLDAVHEELQEYIRHRLLADDAPAAVDD
jgi:AcrR family transcriptional regulator